MEHQAVKFDSASTDCRRGDPGGGAVPAGCQSCQSWDGLAVDGSRGNASADLKGKVDGRQLQASTDRNWARREYSGATGDLFGEMW